MRFDLALSELRLFKSRSQASLAIQDGTALLNGELVKPSHGVRPGDRITVVGPTGRRTCEVIRLPHPSLSRAAARELLREIPQAGARG
ncbi:MAG: S4 domain-containing protein [Candidatus Eisenbacteria bacterium]